MVFGMLAYCGYDVISTVAEETKAPRTLIPQATVLALVVYAVLIIVGMWALSHGGDPEALRAAAEADQMPINVVAKSFWGQGKVLVTLTAISATLGLAIATSVGASRVLFAAARRGSAPAAFARLHPRFLVPWNALHVIFGCGLVGALVSFWLLGAYKAFEWWATTTSYFAMATYLFVNLAVPILKRDRVFASLGRFRPVRGDPRPGHRRRRVHPGPLVHRRTLEGGVDGRQGRRRLRRGAGGGWRCSSRRSRGFSRSRRLQTFPSR